MKNSTRNAMAAVSLLVIALTPCLMAQTNAAPAAQAAPTAQPAPAAATVPAAPQADPFAIALPDGFSAFAKQTQKVADPKVKSISNWVSQGPAGAVVVVVSRMNGKILDPAGTISGNRDGLVKSLKATVQSDEKVAGDPPAENVLLDNGSKFLRAFFVVSDDSLYQLLFVTGSAAQRDASTVQQLFGSFKVLGAPAAASTQPLVTQTTASTSH